LAAETDALLGLEITEINPILDIANKTARHGADFVLSALGMRTL
jgi:arginase family enzyme